MLVVVVINDYYMIIKFFKYIYNIIYMLCKNASSKRNSGAGFGVTSWIKAVNTTWGSARLLFLPRGVYAWIGSYAFHNQVNTGRAMIDIVCAFAWAHGFSCDHPQVIYDKALSSKNERVDRCVICGMRKKYSLKGNVDIARAGAKWRYVSIAESG